MSMQDNNKPTVLQVIASVAAAAFGVQSNKNRERDFAHGSPLVFSAVAVVGTLLFIFAIIAVVKMVLSSHGL